LSDLSPGNYDCSRLDIDCLSDVTQSAYQEPHPPSPGFGIFKFFFADVSLGFEELGSLHNVSISTSKTGCACDSQTIFTAEVMTTAEFSQLELLLNYDESFEISASSSANTPDDLLFCSSVTGEEFIPISSGSNIMIQKIEPASSTITEIGEMPFDLEPVINAVAADVHFDGTALLLFKGEIGRKYEVLSSRNLTDWVSEASGLEGDNIGMSFDDLPRKFFKVITTVKEE
jgi:hypothetical protein